MARKISFENICFGYKKGVPLFHKLSFSIIQPSEKGFIVGLMGNSGSGKSTLLKLLLGTEQIWSGNISIHPKEPVISYIPQEPVLFEHLTPMENAKFFSKTERFKRSFNESRFQEMAALLGMNGLLLSAKSVNEISGGQKQRISLLRALSINPDILLLDEPLTGLDERIKYSFLVILARLAKEYNLMMIYVTHHRQEIELISDEILFLEQDKELGYIHEIIQQQTSTFFEKPLTLSALYLSKDHNMNVLPVEIDSHTGQISLCGQDESGSNKYSISFHHDAIHFDENDGWDFRVIAETSGYIFLQLVENESVVVIPAHEDRICKTRGNRILLNGNVDIYKNEKFFISKTITKNHITNL